MHAAHIYQHRSVCRDASRSQAHSHTRTTQECWYTRRHSYPNDARIHRCLQESTKRYCQTAYDTCTDVKTNTIMFVISRWLQFTLTTESVVAELVTMGTATPEAAWCVDTHVSTAAIVVGALIHVFKTQYMYMYHMCAYLEAVDAPSHRHSHISIPVVYHSPGSTRDLSYYALVRSIPLQLTPSASSRNPTGQPHTYEPIRLRHAILQPPLSTKHSSISTGQWITFIWLYMSS